jgi:C4-dicarboxylate-specific signal transduction histidine kinase
MEGVKDKRIDICVYGAEQYVAVEVSDCGSGIKKEDIKKLFTPFFTTKKMGKGTGLGLAISYGIIKMHNGEINAANGENGGAVFTMKLPRAQNKGEYDVHTLKGRENFTG